MTATTPMPADELPEPPPVAVAPPVVIYRRKRRPTGKATYWVEDDRYGTIQINSDRAKAMVAVGVGVWAGEPLITDLVKD